jgi:hypothetical protein
MTGTEFSCEMECKVSLKLGDLFKQSSAGEVEKFRTCMEECFSKATNLLDQDKKLNKSATVHLYAMGYETNRWNQLILNASENCELGTSESLNENLAIYFQCLEKYLVDNCFEFHTHHGCSEVMMFHKKCRNVKPDCSIMPQDIGLIDHCCDFPPLFTGELINRCTKDCRKKEYFVTFESMCTLICIHEQTKIVSDGKINLEVAKKLLMKNANATVDWSKEIDATVESCSKLGEFSSNCWNKLSTLDL